MSSTPSGTITRSRVHTLLPGKSREVYVRLWSIIKDRCPAMRVTTLVMDYESAAIAAANETFPTAHVQGCFFHLSQCVWRKIQSLGLTNAYVENEEVRTFAKALCALAFLPEQMVPEAFEQMEERLERSEVADSLLELYAYFEDTYIGRPRRRHGRRPPLFMPAMWNVRVRTRNGIPRTTNQLEGWHNAMQGMFDSPHPSMWRFLQGIGKEESLQYARLQQYLLGDPAPPPAQRYKVQNERLRTLIDRFDEHEVEYFEFLRGVGHNLNLNV